MEKNVGGSAEFTCCLCGKVCLEPSFFTTDHDRQLVTRTNYNFSWKRQNMFFQGAVPIKQDIQITTLPRLPSFQSPPQASSPKELQHGKTRRGPLLCCPPFHEYGP
jgi:hypothetical protein